jgi:DNA-binding MarR family transcriptional regulator
MKLLSKATVKMAEPTPSPEDPAAEAWTLLFQLFKAQRREMMAVHAEFKLNPAQGHLMLMLEPGRASPMSELADALCFDASYITGLVDKVEARGLVERRPSPEDRRVKLVALTEFGLATRAGLVARISQPPPFIAALSQDDKIALRDIFRRAARAAQLPSPPN